MLSHRLTSPSMALKLVAASATIFYTPGSFNLSVSAPPSRHSVTLPGPIKPLKKVPPISSTSQLLPSQIAIGTLPSGVEEAFMEFVSGQKRVTGLTHELWKKVVQRGDIVVDATCGNGHDTLALLKMVADESGRGCVYGMDIQSAALENTSSLLDTFANSHEFQHETGFYGYHLSPFSIIEAQKRKLVKLFLMCHSKMEDVIPEGSTVRLVAFNLGYLPGGDKSQITTPDTTLEALHAASRIVGSGGLITAVVYVGHPGGRDELETVQAFSSGLSPETWVCCKLETLNRPLSPVLVLLFKK